MILYAFLGLVLIWFIDCAIPVIYDYLEARRLKREGVVFMGNNTYSLIRDTKLFI